MSCRYGSYGWISIALLILITCIVTNKCDEYSNVKFKTDKLSAEIHKQKESNGNYSDFMCRYRDSVLPTDIFLFHSGYGCYNYNSIYVFKNNSYLSPRTCIDERTKIPYPCFQLNNTFVPYDPRNDTYSSYVAKTFKKESDSDRWKRCFQASLQCCNKIKFQANSIQDPSLCPAVWDGWECWDEAPEGTIQQNFCKEYTYSAGSAPSCHFPSRKECFSRNSTLHIATWNVTSDYTGCKTGDRLRTRFYFHIGVLSFTMLCSIPAVVIFFSYRRLRIPRVALHRNLLTAIIFRCIFTILQTHFILLDAVNALDQNSLMEENNAECKLLSSLVVLSLNYVTCMMLLEGIFLHRLIAAAFKSEPKMIFLYSFGAAVATVPVIIWSALRVTMYDVDCWATDSQYNYQWINDGTRIAMLTINVVLMIDIIRVLVMKMRGVSSHKFDKIRNTIRATLYLLPVFGVNVLLMAYRPTITSCDWEQFFFLITYVVEGLQGCCVALLYCYINTEVNTLVKRTLSNVFPKLFNGSSGGRLSGSNLPRLTLTTNVYENNN